MSLRFEGEGKCVSAFWLRSGATEMTYMGMIQDMAWQR
ncbi:hypothetical protein BUUB107078_26065 [Burkholderia ubonensis]|nr:hypothetical protein BUB20358_02215 [Burkholderia ubonensis]